MSLVERLEKRAKELDRAIVLQYYERGKHIDGYDLQAADDRELLEQAAKQIRELEVAFDELPSREDINTYV